MSGHRLLIILAILLLSGCGYHHPASHPAGAGTITIHAGTWENRTNEIALEGLLLQKTADWLQQSRAFRLEADPNRADYLISGTIETVANPATAFNSGDRATTLNAWVKVTYRLIDRAGGKTLWEINDTVRERNYQAGDNAVRNRSNKEEALAVIAEELAEQIYLKVISSLNLPPAQPTK
jgi:outer membrane lipopolysaccharide assembly protein LptE/RlpB